MIQKTTNPFPGLRPFQEDESHLFFGREEQTDELMRRLKQHRFLAVVGTSGSGKSSLVRAGLLPSLYQGFMTQAGSHWQVAMMRPEDRPIANLAEALSQTFSDQSPIDDLEMHRVVTETTLQRGSLGLVEVVQNNPMQTPTNILVVVDQFEEIFRFKHQTSVQGEDQSENRAFGDAGEETAAFVKLLLAAAQSEEMAIYVVITMRSDFLGDCAQFRELPEAMNESQYLIPRMTREQKRRAIEGPVAVGNGEMTPALVNRLLNDVGDSPDQLPVLQHALMRTWEKWREISPPEPVIDIHHYQDIGGMEQALSRHADEIYQGLPEELQPIAESLFKALTENGPDNRGIRRPTLLGQISEIAKAEPKDVKRVVDAFRGMGKSFLMPPQGTPLKQDTRLDISHESLMRVWEQLKEWVRQETESAKIYQRLADTARRFEAGTAPYLQNPELAIVQTWCNDKQPNQAWANQYDPDFSLAMEFLEASRHAASQADQKRQRQRRFIQWTLGGATIFSSLVAIFAVYQLQRAELQRMRQYKATSELIVSTNPLEGLKNGIAAVGLGQSSLLKLPKLNQADLVSSSILSQPSNQVVSKVFRGDGDKDWFRSVGFSPDGQFIVSGSEDGTVRLWNLDGKAIGEPFQEHGESVLSVGFSPDGQFIVSGSEDGTVRLWNLNGEAIGEPFQRNGGSVWSVGFSPDGQFIVSGSEDGTVRLWNLDGEAIGEPFQGNGGSVLSVGFSPDGQSIVSGSSDGTVRLWNLDGEAIGEPFQGNGGIVWSVGFSPDGQSIVSGSSDGTVRLWNLDGEAIGEPFQGNGGIVWSVGFSPDGQSIVSGREDGTVRLWNLDGETTGELFQGHGGHVLSVGFSPDGQSIVSGSEDGTVRLWNLDRKAIGEPFQGNGGSVWSVGFSPDGQSIVSGSEDGTVRLWNLDGEAIGEPFQGHGGRVWSVGFSPNGQSIVSGSDDGTVRLWNLDGEAIGEPFQGHGGSVFSVGFSPDGQSIVSGNDDGTVRLWNLDGEAIGEPFQGHGGLVWSVGFSPDGQFIVSGSEDGTMRLWNLGGEAIGEPFQGHGDWVRSVGFSPDGQSIVSGSEDGTVRLWNLDGEAIGEPFQGHGDWVWSVGFSPDSQSIVSGSSDGTVRLWNLDGDAIGEPLKGNGGRFLSVGFSPDSQSIVSGSSDGTVRLWKQWPWPGWLTIACQRLSRSDRGDEVSQEANRTCQREVWSKIDSKVPK